MGVILPKVDLMCVEGFDKIFKNDIVQIDFSKSLNILLGGNGLGKTTLLQCIVYGLTGGTNIPEVELLKAFRWDHNFFRKRVKVERQQDARITIEFSMSEKKFKVVEQVKEYVKEKKYQACFIDGVRISYEDGWALIRASNTGPNITLRFEAKTEDFLNKLKEELLKTIK